MSSHFPPIKMQILTYVNLYQELNTNGFAAHPSLAIKVPLYSK